MAVSGNTHVHLRVCVSGSSGAGKSSLITRIVADVCPQNPPATIGVDYRGKDITTSHDLPAAIHFRDLAGQERFNAVCSSSYRGADAVLVVFDLTPGSARGNDVQQWIDRAKQYANETVPILLVANKLDEADSIQSRAMGLARHGVDFIVEARSYSGSVYYASAKTGAGVDTLVEALCHILESTERYIEAASASAVQDALRGVDDAVGTVPDPGASLINIVSGAGGLPRIVKGPQFVKLVGGDPTKEPGSSPSQGSSASPVPSAESRRASGSGVCAC